MPLIWNVWVMCDMQTEALSNVCDSSEYKYRMYIDAKSRFQQAQHQTQKSPFISDQRCWFSEAIECLILYIHSFITQTSKDIALIWCSNVIIKLQSCLRSKTKNETRFLCFLNDTETKSIKAKVGLHPSFSGISAAQCALLDYWPY